MRRASVILLVCMGIGLSWMVVRMFPLERRQDDRDRMYDQSAQSEWFPPLRSGKVLQITKGDPQRSVESRSNSSPAHANHFFVRTFGRLPAASERRLVESLRAGLERDESDARTAASRAVSASDRFAEGKLRAAAYRQRACLSLLERGEYITTLPFAKVPEPATHDAFSCGSYALEDGTMVQAVFYVDKSDPTYAKICEYTSVSREQMFEDTILELNRLDVKARQQRFEESGAAAKALDDISRSGQPARNRGMSVEALKSRILPDQIEFDPVRGEFRRSKW